MAERRRSGSDTGERTESLACDSTHQSAALRAWWPTGRFTAVPARALSRPSRLISKESPINVVMPRGTSAVQWCRWASQSPSWDRAAANSTSVTVEAESRFEWLTSTRPTTTEVDDRLRAACASLPSLLATFRNGSFDPQALNEWLVQIGEIDPPTDGEGNLRE